LSGIKAGISNSIKERKKDRGLQDQVVRNSPKRRFGSE
jgi:hypothetical protein